MWANTRDHPCDSNELLTLREGSVSRVRAHIPLDKVLLSEMCPADELHAREMILLKAFHCIVVCKNKTKYWGNTMPFFFSPTHIKTLTSVTFVCLLSTCLLLVNSLTPVTDFKGWRRRGAFLKRECHLGDCRTQSCDCLLGFSPFHLQGQRCGRRRQDACSPRKSRPLAPSAGGTGG